MIQWGGLMRVQGQDAVYKEVSGLVAAVVEGNNGCVLAFGQSGSGKAHTLAGTPQHPGINFRAMSHLFQCALPPSFTQMPLKSSLGVPL